MKKLNKILNTLCFMILTGLLSACQPSQTTPTAQIITLHGKTMGTTYTIKYLPTQNPNLPEAQTVQLQINDLLNEVNRQMSTYQKDSEISQFNQLKDTSGSLKISDDFATVVNEAIRLNHLTEGGLDVTVGALVNLWGFGAEKPHNPNPSPEQIQHAQSAVGIDKIILQNNILSKKHPDVYLDLSAIAKGFGVDKVAQHLDKLQINDYLVEIGGELRAKGQNPQKQFWQVGIEHPSFAQEQNSQIVVPLKNQALATSGDYRNFRTDEHGKRLSHIINPKNFQPISHNLASISVIAPSTMTADGLATGLYVLGETEALKIAEQEKIPVFFIIKTPSGFETQMSSEFKKLIQTP